MIKRDLIHENQYHAEQTPDLSADSLDILIVEDHPLYRDGLKFCLTSPTESTAPKFNVVEVHDIRTALQKIAQQPHINLAVIDVVLPGLNGIDGMKQLLQAHPKLSCVILSSNMTMSIAEKAKRAGAVAVMDKSTPGPEIRSAIFQIAKSLPIPNFSEDFEARNIHQGKLTERQIEITKLLAHGLRNKIIGDQLGISENTVRIHISNIFRALDCTSRTEAVHVARSLGILE